MNRIMPFFIFATGEEGIVIKTMPLPKTSTQVAIECMDYTGAQVNEIEYESRVDALFLHLENYAQDNIKIIEFANCISKSNGNDVMVTHYCFEERFG